MILYKTSQSLYLQADKQYFQLLEPSLDLLLARDDLPAYLNNIAATFQHISNFDPNQIQAPIDHQEVWAAGVTYYRSRSARIEESKDAGGGDFYDRVYSADRPELFFKAMPHKVAGTNSPVRIRSDAHWSVPEPELALVVNPRGKIVGYTIGNDMSSRDIEGTNPLYLPQAKVYDRSCALGPGILIQAAPMPPTTEISLNILRNGQPEFQNSIQLSEMKRDPQTLVDYLYRDQTFPHGAILLTGTGIIPPDSFTLHPGDEIQITITNIGTLTNHVA